MSPSPPAKTLGDGSGAAVASGDDEARKVVIHHHLDLDL